jgi:effector-binding domain-containing protein
MYPFCGIIPPRPAINGTQVNVQKLSYGIGAFLALLIIIGFALPRTNQVEVTIEIDAHQATVFALINDFQRFALWSPWADTDPNARFLYAGPNRGVGAMVTWDGAIIGSGNQVISKSLPFERVEIAMNPGEPGEAKSWFELSPGIGTTIVIWGFEADYGHNIVGRYFAPMLGGVVARDYHDGLVALKELAEGLPRADFSDLEIEHIVVEAADIAFLSTTSQPEPAAISDALGKAYFRILSFVDDNRLTEAGAPLSVMHRFNRAELSFDAAIPVRGITDETPRHGAGVRIGQTYAGHVIRIRHVGSYESLASTHRKVSAFLAALGIERNGAAWESYVSDPGKVSDEDLLTYVYYPINVN